MVKKYILILALSANVLIFSNVHLSESSVITFMFLSVLSFISASILRPVKAGKFIFKLSAFIFIPFLIFISGGFSAFSLLYILVLSVFFIFGNYFDYSKFRKNVFSFVFIIPLLILIAEPFFIPGILYSAKTHKKTKQLPDFELKDLEGNIITKQDFKGKIVFLDFWTVTCRSCIAQFPAVYKAAEKFKDNTDVKFYLINYNGALNEFDYVKDFIKTKDIKLPVLMDNNATFAGKLNCRAFPQSFIIDKDLNIIYHHTGYRKETEDLFIKDIVRIIKTAKNE